MLSSISFWVLPKWPISFRGPGTRLSEHYTPLKLSLLQALRVSGSHFVIAARHPIPLDRPSDFKRQLYKVFNYEGV